MHDPRIFICYRREDSSDRAHRLHESLSAALGEGEVFIDLDVPQGVGVRSYITEKLDSCAVLLVVIGPDWLEARDEGGKRRLDNELDYVRLEIATALRNDATRIIPLRVKGARMPLVSELPADLAPLADLNAPRLADDEFWRDGIRHLVRTIRGHLEEHPIDEAPQPPAPAPAPRLAGIAPPADDDGGGNVSLKSYFLGRRIGVLGFVVILAVVAAIVVITSSGSEEQLLRIYSSLPELEPREPSAVATNGSSQNLSVVKNQRTSDMENAIRLALTQARGKAGKFKVVYQALDDAGPKADSPVSVVQANANRAAADEHTAVYIGDFTSGATQQSIPILSRAKVPQISPAATRVGLTMADPRGDVDEPRRYYPTGYRNFLRIIPNGAVHAKALLALMTSAGKCTRVVMINDGSPYGQALANNIRDYNDGRVKFVFSQPVGPYQRYKDLVDRVRAMNDKPDCFVYSGTRNPNTVEIFESFADALPHAELYGTNGVAGASFYDPRQGGLPSSFASHVTVMVPPRDVRRTQPFIEAFNQAYGRNPDPYAVYAYEATRLALSAIVRSATGSRADIRAALFSTADRRDSMLGPYSIEATGDTTLRTYDWSHIREGTLTRPQATPGLTAR